MRVRDWMTQGVTGVPPTMKTGDVLALLLRHNLNGIPVVDEEQRLLGLVSLSDIVRRIHLTQEELHQDQDFMRDPKLMEERFVDVARLPAGEIATKAAKSVSPDDRIVNVGTMLRAYHIKQMPVVENGKVVGLITSADVFWGFLVNYWKHI